MLGRLSETEKGIPVLMDCPSKVLAALLTKQDEMISLLKELAIKLDSDSGVADTDYAETLSDALEAIELKL